MVYIISVSTHSGLNAQGKLKDGRLRLVLTEWSPLEEGFYIYYSSRRQLPTGLRLLIEFIQEAKPLGL